MNKTLPLFFRVLSSLCDPAVKIKKGRVPPTVGFPPRSPTLLTARRIEASLRVVGVR